MLILDKQQYEEQYEATLPDGRVIGYGREFLQRSNHWQRQREVLGRLEGSILIVGCGFSPLLTAFNGGHRTWGTDPSPYIQANKHTESDVPHRILPYAVPDSRLRRNWDHVITDDVLPGFDFRPPAVGSADRPSEVVEFLDACDDLGTRVVHFVSPNLNPPYSAMPLDHWSVLAPHHVWIDNITMEVHRG